MRPLLSALLFALAWLPADASDVVQRVEGKPVTGRVLYEDAGEVVVQVGRKQLTLARDEVAQVESLERSLDWFLARHDALPAGDVQALGELAAEAATRGLAAESANAWLRVLTLDPENEAAWQALGGKSGSKGWQLKRDGRWATLEKHRENAASWKKAWSIPTAHFLVRSDLPLERVLDIALDVERTHRAFYGLIVPHAKLFVFDELPELNVYAQEQDYPRARVPGELAWVDTAANRLHVLATADAPRSEIVHQLTRLLIFNALRRTTSVDGATAPWVARGMAGLFGLGLRGDPGRRSFDLAGADAATFRLQARADEPLALKRLLDMDVAAFTTGSHYALARAEAYTLVHFLLHGADGRYREAFYEFMRSAYAGKRAASHFAKLLPVELDALDAEWQAYVAEQAGG